MALLATMTTASAIDGVIQWKMCGWGVVRWEKRITLVISNEDSDDIFRIISSLENSNTLIDGASETVKHEIKKQENWIFAVFIGILWNSVLGTMLAERCIMRIGKGIMRAGRGYNNTDKRV